MPDRWIRVIPNVLSTARLILALAFPWVSRDWRLGVIVAAGLSDLADGALSRLLRVSSTFGRVLDPLADKLFIGIALITLVREQQHGFWVLALVLFRDLAVIGGSTWCTLRSGFWALRHMPPSWLGKATTLAQFVCLVVLVYDDRAFRAVFIPTAALSVWAGVDYLRRASVGTQPSCEC